MTDLTGRTVLLPRSPARAAGLAGLLRRAGAEVTVAPVIERAPADDGDALAAAVSDVLAGRYAWVVITSVNAVEALTAAQHHPTGATSATLAAAPVRWAAVGPATVRALADAGIAADLVPDGEASADGLVATFPAPSSADPASTGPVGTRVLLPLGDRARPTLREALRALGWAPDVVTAYRTVRSDLPADVVGARYDIVVVTSGSVAREIATQYGTHAPVVAIGRPSAEAAREAGLTVAAVADRPTDAALAAAVTTACEGEP
ncbi:uroporphyrinogen-III synthase/uroporphyrinogen III methyltransferase/synthase [Isoptericola sp. CG 20/1183]|uniref:Uroporphyrinogen-III synthase n=1 Tax=Isoptericola halotolerans TaxID=300560 RepID=A0ABX5EIB1_9MICO|nr:MULTISPECIES: uroporphyrinogen-III synthase [Isoptericola]PRZ08493.1 uroporphyrinogen-III synthase/uroporphyrinogen III methyltransferase/synthase [Isoptericola halotolerans]PRZ11060.1 uroporphyrinogen-III synthase/uroporphyrinogen III methyltransferase/synthase [Isoptericola sp. CG 20/1183]